MKGSKPLHLFLQVSLLFIKLKDLPFYLLYIDIPVYTILSFNKHFFVRIKL